MRKFVVWFKSDTFGDNLEEAPNLIGRKVRAESPEDAASQLLTHCYKTERTTLPKGAVVICKDMSTGELYKVHAKSQEQFNVYVGKVQKMNSL